MNERINNAIMKVHEATKNDFELARAFDELLDYQKNLEKRIEKENNYALYGASLVNSLHDLNETCGLFMNYGYCFISKNEFIAVAKRNFYDGIVKKFQGILSHNLGYSVVKYGMNKKTFSIKDMIDMVVKMYDFILEREKIEIVNENVNDFMIEVDCGTINIFIQIFDNAIGAIKGKGSGTILIESDSTRKSVTIYNSGDRIPEKDLPYIFEPFFSTKEDHPGLGLTMAKEVAERNGATIHHVLNDQHQSGFEVGFADAQAK